MNSKAVNQQSSKEVPPLNSQANFLDPAKQK